MCEDSEKNRYVYIYTYMCIYVCVYIYKAESTSSIPETKAI